MPCIRIPVFYIFLICSLLLSSCGKRYWYRLKLRDSKPLYSVRVKVINQSPSYISPKFEEEMKVASLKELKKKGFIPSVKDSPMYEFVLRLEVDSFNAGVRNFRSEYPGYQPDLSHARSVSSSGVYNFRKPVKAMMIRCKLQHFKNKSSVWENNEDLYFFNDYRKDLGRTYGMVRYLIRSGGQR
jgi:hypothetical protein